MKKMKDYNSMTIDLLDYINNVVDNDDNWDETKDVMYSVIANELSKPYKWIDDYEDDKYYKEENDEDEEEIVEKIFIGNFKKEIKPIITAAAKKVKIYAEFEKPSCGTRGYFGVRVHKPESMKTLSKFWKYFESYRDDVYIGAVSIQLKNANNSRICPPRVLDL